MHTIAALAAGPEESGIDPTELEPKPPGPAGGSALVSSYQSHRVRTETPKIKEHRRPTKEEQEDKPNNVTFMAPRHYNIMSGQQEGTSESYTIRRLRSEGYGG